MRLAVVQLGPAGPDVEQNVARACDLLKTAVEEHGADLAVLPEFANTWYFPQSSAVSKYWDLAERSDGPSLTRFRETARDLGCYVVAPIYEEAMDGLHFDSAFFLGPEGDIRGCYRKTHAPAIDGGYEKLYYTPGSRYPVFDLEEWRVGLLICYDWRFPEAARALAIQGAHLILYPFATGAMRMWREALATRAWENQVYLAAANRAGQEGDWLFSGESLIVDPYGEIIVDAGPEGACIVSADLDMGRLREARVRDFNWRDRRPDTYDILSDRPEQRY
jgi:N-carbamoylputrescine amidase